MENAWPLPSQPTLSNAPVSRPSKSPWKAIRETLALGEMTASGLISCRNSFGMDGSGRYCRREKLWDLIFRRKEGSWARFCGFQRIR